MVSSATSRASQHRLTVQYNHGSKQSSCLMRGGYVLNFGDTSIHWGIPKFRRIEWLLRMLIYRHFEWQAPAVRAGLLWARRNKDEWLTKRHISLHQRNELSEMATLIIIFRCCCGFCCWWAMNMMTMEARSRPRLKAITNHGNWATWLTWTKCREVPVAGH